MGSSIGTVGEREHTHIDSDREFEVGAYRISLITFNFLSELRVQSLPKYTWKPKTEEMFGIVSNYNEIVNEVSNCMMVEVLNIHLKLLAINFRLKQSIWF